MSLRFPEFAVYNVVASRVAALVDASSTLVDKLLADRTPADRDAIRTALRQRTVTPRWGFPFEPPEDASVIVMLTHSGKDRGGTLGDQVGTVETETGIALTSADMASAEPGVLPLAAAPEIPVGVGRVRLGGTELALYSFDGTTVTLQARGIRETTPEAWAEGTTVVFHDLTRELGWPKLNQIRVDVVSSNYEFSALLAAMLEAFLAAAVVEFETAGLTLHDIQQTDMAPRPDAYPVHFMARSLMLTVRTTLVVPQTLTLVTGIEAIVDATGVDVVAGYTPPGGTF